MPSRFDEFVQMCASAVEQAQKAWRHHMNFLICDWPALRRRWLESLGDEPLTDEQKRQACMDWILNECRQDEPS